MPTSTTTSFVFPYNNVKEIFENKADYDISQLQNRYTNDLILQIVQEFT
jgi:hypothetical protein